MTINSGANFARLKKYYSVSVHFKGELLHFYEYSEIEALGSFRIKRLVSVLGGDDRCIRGTDRMVLGGEN